jgi:uncharacterized membrane protein YbaN (DUF454 family)
MKYFYLVAGLIFLGMSGVGAILPLIPTTPFVLLAAFCLGKSSERLHGWFTSTRLYKNNIESFVTKRAMTVTAKLKLLLMITLLMGVGFFMMRLASTPTVAQMVLVVIWILHVLYFGFRVKTIW